MRSFFRRRDREVVVDRGSTKPYKITCCGGAEATLAMQDDGICVIDIRGVFSRSTAHLAPMAHRAAVAMGATGLLTRSDRAVLAITLEEYKVAGAILADECDVPGAIVGPEASRPTLYQIARFACEHGHLRAVFSEMDEAFSWVRRQALMAQTVREQHVQALRERIRALPRPE